MVITYNRKNKIKGECEREAVHKHRVSRACESLALPPLLTQFYPTLDKLVSLIHSSSKTQPVCRLTKLKTFLFFQPLFFSSSSCLFSFSPPIVHIVFRFVFSVHIYSIVYDWSLLIYLGNILRVSKELQENNEEDFELKLIDFEFSAYNYR